MVLQKCIRKSNKFFRGFINFSDKPAFHNSGKGYYICVRHKRNVGIVAFGFFGSDLASYLLNRAVDNGINVRFKKALEMFAPYGMKRAKAYRAVFFKVAKKLQKPFLPKKSSFVLFKKRNSLFLKHPAHKVICVLKVIIKILPPNSGKLGYIMYCNFFKRLLSHKLFKRGGKSMFCLVRCGIGSLLH